MTIAKADPVSRYPHIVRAVYGTPWMIQREYLELILDITDFRAAGGILPTEEIEARVAAADNGPREGRQSGAVAVLPVYGIISPRQNLMSMTSGGTSIEQLKASFREVLADGTVSAIVLDVDSPGGLVDGVDELATEIRASRGEKPIVAVANTMAASAAYYLASAADEIVVMPSGQVGSIGVIAAHTDDTAAREQMGLKRTLISAGKHKADGWAGEPLSEDGLAYEQAQIDELYGMFVNAVAKGRGVPVATVRGGYGEGRMLLAKAALAAGMVDRIDTLDNTVRRLLRTAQGQASGAAAIAGTRLTVAGGRVSAGPVRSHSTDTSDDAWDAAENEARLASPMPVATARSFYGWIDDDQVDGDEMPKAAGKFGHHFVSADGEPGAASTKACSNGIAVLNGGRGGADIPAGDRPGVHAHLAGHLEDAGQDAPPLSSEAPAALGSGLPYAEHLELVAAEGEALAERTRERVAMRAHDGRGLSAASRERLVRLRDGLDGVLAAAPARRVSSASRSVLNGFLAEAYARGYQPTDTDMEVHDGQG